MTINRTTRLRESEDNVEFQRSLKKDFPGMAESHTEQKERRKCFLRICSRPLLMKGGGHLVLGWQKYLPHNV